MPGLLAAEGDITSLYNSHLVSEVQGERMGGKQESGLRWKYGPTTGITEDLSADGFMPFETFGSYF